MLEINLLFSSILVITHDFYVCYFDAKDDILFIINISFLIIP